MVITFLCGGKMATSLIEGLQSISHKGLIQVIEPEKKIREKLKNHFNVIVLDKDIEDQYKNFISNSDVLILSIKPQTFKEISVALEKYVSKEQTIISIMAGISIPTITNYLKSNNIIRIMPNTPVQVKSGMSMWTASENVNSNSLDFCKNLLKSIGKEIYTSNENNLDIATAISGSGPAYVFLMIESLTESGVRLGLEYDISLELAIQTVFGAGKLALLSNISPKELRKNVTSPGGTTEAGIKSMLKNGLDQSIIEGVNAAFEKSIELGNKEKS